MCEAGQNNDCYAGYSISSLQERKQRKLSQTQRQALNFNKNINNQSSVQKRPQAGLV